METRYHNWMKFLSIPVILFLALAPIAHSQDIMIENMKKGASFLSDNKKKEGVKITASGLQYKVLKEGTGKSPKYTDNVTVNYEGTLIDGTVFDSSYKRGEPTSFPVNRVIPGWTEGLQLMKEGDTFMFYIPSNLAYGAQSPSRAIGPNETLVFKVELIKVN